MTYEFKSWGKTPRWANEQMTITEKIDGTNACVCIFPDSAGVDQLPLGFTEINVNNKFYVFGAQSRTRMITPGKNTDNAGFAAWAYDNAESLIEALGLGRHYGEWWGSGIQGGYGSEKGMKTFSLFDVWKWRGVENGRPDTWPAEMSVVPTLYRGLPSDSAVEQTLLFLEEHGSVASPGYDNPEGIIISYSSTRRSYKAFVNDDGIPKSLKEGK